MVRCGVAEEIGARQSLEDANVTLDNLAAACGPDSADAPCAFYAVRGCSLWRACEGCRTRLPGQMSRPAAVLPSFRPACGPKPHAVCPAQVFDGHGGRDAAVFCREHLVSAVTSVPGWRADVSAALVRARPLDTAPRAGHTARAPPSRRCSQKAFLVSRRPCQPVL